jgi:glucose-6-phosphate isomerase
MDIRFNNLDQTESFKRIHALKPPALETVLTSGRISSFQCSYPVSAGPLLYNYAAKKCSHEILDALDELATEQQLIEKYRMILSGEIMNTGERRMVLHHLCRGQQAEAVEQDGRDLREFYTEQQARFSRFAAGVLEGEITSPAGKQFDTAVQIGIGGSDLGPRALFVALQGHRYTYKGREKRGPMIEARFISNVDPDDAAAELSGLNPATTLFILVSKSGTTQETLTNQAFAVDWLSNGGVENPLKHMVCVTSETSPLAGNDDYLDSFFIDDFIGGRYSASSAVGGTILSLAYGPEVFAELLEGAAAADKAALNPELSSNPALLDAMLGVYERNVLGYRATAVLPYSQALLRFPAHLQQLDMESNGKRVNRDGKPIAYETGPVIFGEPGTNGQHSFFQLLHQGTDVVPLQFVGFSQSQYGSDVTYDGSTSQQKLNANLAAQIVAFALGKSDDNPNRHFPGERPSSLLWAQTLSPRVLGALLAHFENKVVFQGLCWNVNSFDQEGVQLGKILTRQILGGGERSEALAAYAQLVGLPDR